MPDLKGQPYIILNYNQDSGQSDAFQPDTIPDYRGALSIVRYRDNTRPAYNGDRLIAALNRNETDPTRWATILHGEGFQQITGSLTLNGSVLLGTLLQNLDDTQTEIPFSAFSSREGLGSTHDLQLAYVDNYISIGAEMMYITAINIADQTYTVVRGALLMGAVSHTAGESIYRHFSGLNVFTNNPFYNETVGGTVNFPMLTVDPSTAYGSLNGESVLITANNLDLIGNTTFTLSGGTPTGLVLVDAHLQADHDVTLGSDNLDTILIKGSPIFSADAVFSENVLLQKDLNVRGSTILGDAAGDLITVRGTATFNENSTFNKDIAFKTGIAHTIEVASAVSGNAGNNLTVDAGDGTGTNKLGGNLILRSGLGTGNNSPSSIQFYTPTPTTSGSGAQSYVLQGQIADTTQFGFNGDTILRGNVQLGVSSAYTIDTVGTPTFRENATFDKQITVTGTANLNGAVNVGDAAADTITVKGTATFNENSTFDKAINFKSGILLDPIIEVNAASSNTGTNLTVKAGDGNGTDKAGGGLYLKSGSQTGNATASSIYLQTPDSSTSTGSSPRLHNTRVQIATATTTVNNNLTVVGTTTLNTGLTGVLQASSGTVTAGTIAEADISNTIYTMTVGPFWYPDLAASVTDGVGQLLVPSNSTPTMVMSTATNANRWHVPATGKIVGIAAHGIVTRTAGSATFYPRINNVQNTGISVVINNTQTQNNTTMVGYNSGVSISSGDKLAVSVDTTSTWAPTTGDMQIFLYVAFIVTK